MSEKILQVENLKVYFPIRKGIFKRTAGYVKAVDDVSFEIKKAETFGLVGESGCGKTTVAKTVARLLKATSGKVKFKDLDGNNLKARELNQFRQDIAFVFQDPYGSLNPRMTVGDIISEPMRIHSRLKARAVMEKTAHLLDKVGLGSGYINRYPHEFSGGQRQRIGIARALSLEPELIICDEPVSALDVSVQSQILNLLSQLQEDLGLTYLFIAHDLAVVEFMADVIGVMYLGKIVEQGSCSQLYENPLHPYTRELMKAIPDIDPSQRHKKQASVGEIPSPSNPPSGCPFHPRCAEAEDKCSKQLPMLRDTGDGHFVACWKCNQ